MDRTSGLLNLLNLLLNLKRRLSSLFFDFFIKTIGNTKWFYIYFYIFIETTQPTQPILGF
jgi:hypothetical protein